MCHQWSTRPDARHFQISFLLEICFVLKNGERRTEKQWSLPAVIVGRPRGSIHYSVRDIVKSFCVSVVSSVYVIWKTNSLALEIQSRPFYSYYNTPPIPTTTSLTLTAKWLSFRKEKAYCMIKDKIIFYFNLIISIIFLHIADWTCKNLLEELCNGSILFTTWSNQIKTWR